MSDKIPVYIIMTTYDRGDGSRTRIAAESAGSIAEKLSYPNLKWIITDDGSPQAEHLQTITNSILQHTPNVPIVAFNINRQGVGKAKNTALQHAFEENCLIFMCEDDWLLTESLDLLTYAQLMLDYPDVGIIRLGYLGGNLEARYVEYPPFGTFWDIKQGSGVYFYSGQVSLRSQLWYKTVGFHQEGCTPGEEELEMCFRANGTENCPKILWPAKYGTILNAGPFKNIGLGASLNNVQPNV